MFDMMKKDFISVSNEDNITKIEITDTISIYDYLKYVEGTEFGKLPLKVVFIDGYDFLSSSLTPQTIYIYKEDNKVYYVTDSDSSLRVIESVKGSEIEELILDMNKKENTFRITKSLHDLSLSTIYCKSYPMEIDYVPELTLDRLEAFDLTKSLIKRIGEIEELDKIANVYDLYKYTNVLDDKNFHPMIQDEVITISKMFVNDLYDVTEARDEYFDIILNETHEKIGDITFTLYENNFIFSDNTIRYEGNVSYNIKPRYRSNHYATRALKLLVELIKGNKRSADKNLYISTLPDNVCSQRVAINNGAVLYFEGDVPEKESLNFHDGVKAVKIYKITI